MQEIHDCFVLDKELRALGIPIDGVSSGPPLRIDYAAEATQEQRDRGETFKASFTTEPTAWARQERRKQAVALLDGNDALAVALRGLFRLVYGSLAETRRANNLPVRGWEQALQAVRDDIMAGGAD